MRRMMVGFAALCAAVVIAALLVPQGEVVTLHVVDAEGHTHPTQLWIAEHDGAMYLRSASPDTRWLGRLRARPDVTIGSGGVTERPTPYHAVVIEGDPLDLNMTRWAVSMVT